MLIRPTSAIVLGLVIVGLIWTAEPAKSATYVDGHSWTTKFMSHGARLESQRQPSRTMREP